MAPGTIRKALGAVKDQTSISLAKVGGSSMASELDVAIVKATRHDEFPAEERYVREILSLTRYSRLQISNCVASISRRLGKTNSWSVALKALILVHRLLNEGESSFEQEVFFATRCGTRMLNMSDFRDKSRSDAWDFSAFVRTYAIYIDERLECRMQGQKHKNVSVSFIRDDASTEAEVPMGDCWEDRDREKEREREREEGSSSTAIVAQDTPVKEMKNESLFFKAKTLQNLLERFLACRPTGAAKSNRVVNVALHLLLKESFQLYFETQELVGVFVDRFADLEIPECVRVHTVFCRLAKQLDELDSFYSWCKSAPTILRPSEFPDVELISSRKLQLMDDFIRQKSSGNFEEQMTSGRNSSKNVDPTVEEYDMNAIKALPAPEPEPTPTEPEPECQPKPEPVSVPVPEPEPEPNNLEITVQEEVDLLNLKEDAITGQEHGEKLALALFDGNLTPRTESSWQPFDEKSANWENVLVQSASSMAAQNPALGGGLDMMTLNGMYGHAHANIAAAQQNPGYGSASSVVMHVPALTGPQMLALPAPPVSGTVAANGDPFAASLAIPAPSYVQMSEMEKKQQFMMEEQKVWHQYAKDGMQGQASLARLHQQQQQYGPMGGYNRMC
ncbi:ENTH/ANTH/VHS superfamily protein [Rhynchospora pubera]|uniref:ENTH/ANTH/VHS superfamily protein n=1 Tax=Rhynchospora pubera TaxID=906938 RepID=A0AAV8H007_9POAL|nr:ENTH/ANTH/VHS superfamily protein [Rhynchospora pubera]